MPINKRKEVGRRVRGKYPRQKLISAVLAVLQGEMLVPEASEEFKVPARTLRRWVSRGREALKKLLPEEPQVFEMKDYMGPDRALVREDEETLKMFLEDAKLIGVPRSQAQCAVDIQEFVRMQNLKVPFTNEKPGAGYFERFCSDVDGWPITFMSSSDVDDYLYREIDLDEWILNVKQYIIDKQGQLLSDRELVFVVECQHFKTTTKPAKIMSVIILYSGTGHIIRWILVHDGTELSEEVALDNSQTFLLLKTADGKVTSTTLKSTLVILQRHIASLNMEGSPIVYLDQFMAQELTFSVWKYCVSKAMYVMAIPRRLCTAMRTFKLGAMGKFSGKMLFYMHHRFINIGVEMKEMNFVHVTKQIIKTNFQTHLRASLSFLKLNSVVGRKQSEASYVRTEPPSVEPSTSTEVPGPVSSPPAKKKKGSTQKGKGKKRSASLHDERATANVTIASIGCEVGTQTVETNFYRDHLKGMTQYLVSTICKEDFDPKYGGKFPATKDDKLTDLVPYPTRQ